MINLKKLGLSAHIVFKWIHLVFGNLKRWAYGTFHGLREQHLDAYLNEFVFRWNRRRLFQSAMDTMLGIGHRIGLVTYRQIVYGPETRMELTDEIFAQLHPNRQRVIDDLASHFDVTRQEVFDRLRYWIARLRRSKKNWRAVTADWTRADLPELNPLSIRKRRKKPLRRPALPSRQEGDGRQRGGRRYWHPPRPPLEEIKQGYMRHVPM